MDWTSAASQYLRFAQLIRLCDLTAPFSLNDFGCGCGALMTFLKRYHPEAKVTYHGIDLCPAMIEAAVSIWQRDPRASFQIGSACSQVADYSVASGVFNIRLGWPILSWEAYVEDILADLFRHSRRGVAVNFKSLDGSNGDDLYRSTSERWMLFVQKQTGHVPMLLADYGLREFTLLARLG